MNKINSIICTHGDRMRSLVSIIDPDDQFVLKFKNCAILKLEITSQFVLAELIYLGELVGNHSDKNYYNILARSFSKERYFEILHRLHILHEDISSHFCYYIIRHGEGYHNTINIPTKVFSQLTAIGKDCLLDPVLTHVGTLQAENSGIFCRNI